LPRDWTDDEVEALIKFLKENGIWDKDVRPRESTIIWEKVKYFKGLEATLAQRGLDAIQHKARSLKAKAKANKEAKEVKAATDRKLKGKPKAAINEDESSEEPKQAKADTKLKAKEKERVVIDDTKGSDAVNEEDESSEERKQKDGAILKGIFERYETLAEGFGNDEELLENFQKQIKGMISKRCERQKKTVKRLVSRMIDERFDGIQEDIPCYSFFDWKKCCKINEKN